MFLEVIWQDFRIRPITEIDTSTKRNYIQLTSEERHTIWVPDLYIRQLREMRVLSLFEEISSLRLYMNQTISLSIGATIIIKCDMDFVLYPLDVQKCSVDFSSCKLELLLWLLFYFFAQRELDLNSVPCGLPHQPDKYNDEEMIFKWREESPLLFPNDYGDGFFRLPKYVVSFYHSNVTHMVNYGDGK